MDYKKLTVDIQNLVHKILTEKYKGETITDNLLKEVKTTVEQIVKTSLQMSELPFEILVEEDPENYGYIWVHIGEKKDYSMN